MYITSINWDSLQTHIYDKAENAKTIQDLKPAFETLLNGLIDHHGKIISAKDYSYIAWFTENKNRRHLDNRKFDNEVWKIVNDTASKFEYKLLKGKIGYLQIVGIPPNIDIEKESKKLENQLFHLPNKK
jgi:hypothetical protein